MVLLTRGVENNNHNNNNNNGDNSNKSLRKERTLRECLEMDSRRALNCETANADEEEEEGCCQLLRRRNEIKGKAKLFRGGHRRAMIHYQQEDNDVSALYNYGKSAAKTVINSCTAK